MIFGVGFYSFTIGNLSSLIASFDEKNAVLQNKINTLNEYSTRVALPDALKTRIRRYIEANHKEFYSSVDLDDLMNELPSFLKADII